MDKITRILMLYRHLMHGDLINKYSASLEFGISERSFDRDIQDIRLFLSESFSNLELVYDEERRGYCIKNLNLKREIAIGECYILIKLLLDSHMLRTDDQQEIVSIMLSQLPDKSKQRILPVLRHSPKISECLNKTPVKLIEDLLFSIEQKDRISLQFGKDYPEKCCVPYSIEFHNGNALLVAWEIKDKRGVLYPLEDILSYVPQNYPYLLSKFEIEALQELVYKVCNSTVDNLSPYINKKERIKDDGI